jgi:hypothetical protein
MLSWTYALKTVTGFQKKNIFMKYYKSSSKLLQNLTQKINRIIKIQQTEL